MGPNRRAQARERADAAEAERKAVAEAERIVAIWNARQAGERAVALSYDRRRDCSGLAVADVFLPRVVGAIDLRTLNRHPGAAISNLISSVSRRRRICARSGCASSM
jgi:hypothetical protein